MTILGRIATGRPPAEMPWIALRDGVVFPEALTEIAVGGAASLSAIAASQESDGWLGVFAQRTSTEATPLPRDLYAIGCAAQVLSVDPAPEGAGQIVRLQPIARVRAASFTDAREGWVRIERMPESNAPLDPRTRATLEEFAVGALRRVHRWSSRDADRFVRAMATSARLTWLSAAHLTLDVSALQALLESDDVHANAARILSCRDELGAGTPPRPWWQQLWDFVLAMASRLLPSSKSIGAAHRPPPPQIDRPHETLAESATPESTTSEPAPAEPAPAEPAPAEPAPAEPTKPASARDSDANGTTEPMSAKD